jgi:hypothetical protein
MNSEIYNYITSEPFFEGYSKSFSTNDFIRKEIYSEFLLKICEMNQDKLNELFYEGRLKYYCTKVIQNVVFHPTIGVGKKYPDLVSFDSEDVWIEAMNEEEEEYYPLDQQKATQLLKDIKEYLKDVASENDKGWYSQKIFELYYEDYNSLRKMSEDTTIPVSSIYNSINKTKTKINELFREQYNDTKTDWDSFCDN